MHGSVFKYFGPARDLQCWDVLARFRAARPELTPPTPTPTLCNPNPNPSLNLARWHGVDGNKPGPVVTPLPGLAKGFRLFYTRRWDAHIDCPHLNTTVDFICDASARQAPEIHGTQASRNLNLHPNLNPNPEIHDTPGRVPLPCYSAYCEGARLPQTVPEATLPQSTHTDMEKVPPHRGGG